MRKKEFIKIGFSILSIYVLTALVACDNNKDNGAPLPPPGPAIACPAGSTLDYRNLCVTSNGQVVSSTTSNTIDFMSDSYDNTLTITNRDVYKTFLKSAMGVCDNMSWSTGVYDCSSWDNGRLAVVALGSTSTNSLYAYFWPYPENSFNFFNINAGISNTTSYWPLVLTMPTSPYNNSQGFMAQSRGNDYTKSYKSVISIVVNQGKLQDGYFDYMLSYSPDGQPVNATVFASGRFIRCTTKQCVNK